MWKKHELKEYNVTNSLKIWVFFCQNTQFWENNLSHFDISWEGVALFGLVFFEILLKLYQRFEVLS
jgi:hypothetical protein